MPGRVRIPITVLGPDGRPLPGATMAVRRRVDATPVPVFAAETGGTTLSPSQVITAADGRFPGWTERDALEGVITPPVGVTLDSTLHQWEALPAGDQASEADWHSDQSVPGRALTNGTVELDDLAASVLELIFAIGDMWPTCNPGDRAGGRILLADGRTLSSAAFAVLDSKIGASAPAPFTHAYNDGVSPGAGLFRIPDKRGRSSRGADDFGTARGAANRLGSLAAGDRILGQGVGVDAVTLLAAQSGMPAHGHADTFAVAAVQPWTTGWNAPIANTSWLETGVFQGSGVAVYNLASAGANVLADDATVSYAGGSHAHTVTGAVSNAAAVNATIAHTNLDPSELDFWLIRVL